MKKPRKNHLDGGYKKKFLHRLLFLLITTSLFTYLTITYFSDLKIHPFHIDEYLFTQRSYYFDLLVKRDFSDWRWYWNDTSAQPKVGPYLYGITLHLAGVDNIEQKLTKRGFEENLRFKDHWIFRFMHKPLINPPATILPQLELIRKNRITSALFSLGAFLMVFFFTLRIKGLPFAITSTLLLGTNSLMILYGKRAMTDSMQLFFFFLTLLMTTLFLNALEKKNTSRAYFLSVTLGISSALGVGVKVSGILNVLFLMIVFLFLIAFNRRRKKSIILIIKSFLIMAATFMIFFYLLHPYLYHDPLRRFIDMFSSRLIESELYNMQAFPGSAVHTRLKAAQLVIKNTLLPSGDYVNIRSRYLPLDLILFSWGLLQMGIQSIKDITQKKKISGEVILITWVLVVTTSLILYLRNNWDRYYLPSVAAVTLVEAYAISTLLNKLVNRISPGKTKGYLQEPGGRQA